VRGKTSLGIRRVNERSCFCSGVSTARGSRPTARPPAAVFGSSPFLPWQRATFQTAAVAHAVLPALQRTPSSSSTTLWQNWDALHMGAFNALQLLEEEGVTPRTQVFTGVQGQFEEIGSFKR